MTSTKHPSASVAAELDHRYVWHPFTQMQDWMREDPLVIVSGRGALLRDSHCREYIDANSSIWTNLHGHRNPRIDAAIRRQLQSIAHSSALGLANEPSSHLAKALLEAAQLEAEPVQHSSKEARQATSPQTAGCRMGTSESGPQPRLTKVFYSDDGSTAMECALKMAYEFGRRTHRTPRPRFLSLGGAYHGDTIGAVSLGHIDLFHRAYSEMLFRTDEIMSPYCYRCPFNRARPERADARSYRRCKWECVDEVASAFERARRRRHPYTAIVVEPAIQGAAGMIPQPEGWLRQVARLARSHGALLIADEILTGFGRATRDPHVLFAAHEEGVQPDLMALAKGLTGGYLPMAATLTSQPIFNAFLGEYREFKTFFHGHSYTGNQLGSAAALTSLRILHSPTCVRQRSGLRKDLAQAAERLWRLKSVGDIRQVGSIVAVELVSHWRTRKAWDPRDQVGIRVCRAMRDYGVLTRPVGNVIVVMPPYCTRSDQVEAIFDALAKAVRTTVGQTAC